MLIGLTPSIGTTPVPILWEPIHKFTIHQKMQNLTLNLSLDEVNKILEALGNLPFVQVHELIRSIQEQATAQLSKGNQEQPR